MKKLSFLLAIVLTVTFAKADIHPNKSKKSLPENTPRTNIPSDLVGQWQMGSFSLTTWWGYDGSYKGNAGSYSLSYKITKDGYAEQYLFIEQNSYGFRTQVLGYRKGTITYDAVTKTLEFFATEGNYRSFMGSKKTEKQYGANDLYPQYKDLLTNVSVASDTQGKYLVCTGKSGSQSRYKKLN